MLRLSLSGSRSGASPEGHQPLASVSNYLLGNDPTKWMRRVPNQSQVVYPEIYPGVDLIFHGRDGELEHDFCIAPGADPHQIRLAIDGADNIAIGSSGDLEIALNAGTLVFQKPQAYQETAQGRKIVASSFRLNHDGSVQFQLGEYDRRLELVIDPVFIFSTYLAGNSGDWPIAITSDSAGNVYVTGYTDSTTFPIENGIQTTLVGSPDVFVSKLDPTGTTLLYSTYLGGSYENYGNSIAVDANGNIIVAGTSSSNDFPHAGSVSSLTCEGNNQCYFLASLKPDGSAFNYSRLIGGIEGTDAQAGGGPGAGNIVADVSGNVYLTGVTDDPNFQITSGTLASGVQGGGYPYNSTFIMKVSPTGALTYSTIVPGTAEQSITVNLNNVFVAAGISVDGNGQVTIAGTAGPGLPSTTGVIQPTFPNSQSVENPSAGFVLQINSTASAINYATYVPGTDLIGGYAADGQGNSYFTGQTSETNLPVSSNAYQKTLKAGQNCTCNSGFILKLNGTGTTVLAATYLEGTPLAPYNLGTRFMGLALDSKSNVFVGGITGSPDFPLTDPFTSFLVSNGSMVLAEMPSDLSSLLFGSFLSSTDQSFPASSFAGISVDNQNHLLVVGQTSTTDFPTTPGSFQPTPPSQAYHAFVVSFDMATPAPSACLDSWSVSFGSVNVKQSGTQVVDITNCGNAPLSIASIVSSANTVTVQQSCGNSIEPGAVCPLSLVFIPLSNLTLYGTLTITDNAQIPTQVIQFSGQGVAPELMPPTGSFNFGHLLINTAGVGMPLFFYNAGTAPLTISSASVIGDFTISKNTCLTTLPPSNQGLGIPCSITVIFSPTAAGIRTGTLTVVSNDPLYPQAGLSLVGFGDTSYAVPVITYLGSPTAQINNGPITVQVDGANFYPASVITANGVAQQTTYSSGQELQATLSSAVSGAIGEISIAVSNPSPGGGNSVALPFTLFEVLNLDPAFLTTVPGSSLIYASIPSSATTNPDTVMSINPANGALGTPIPVGTNPTVLAPSSDGSYLFVASDQNQTIQRINLSTNTVEATFPYPPLGIDCCGALAAVDMKALPGGTPQEVVLATNISGYGFGEMALYNNSGMVNYVPTNTSSIASPPAFESFAYAGNPLTIYALPFTTAENSFFSVVTIGPQGLGYTPLTAGNYGGNNSTGGIVASDGTLLYTSGGEVWNPTTQTQTGSFPVTTYNEWANMVLDTSTEHIFILGDENYQADSSAITLSAYGQQSLALTGILPFPQISDPIPDNFIRWGTNGFAFLGPQVYLLTSSLATPVASNPVPQIGSVTPNSTPQGSQALVLTVNGQGFTVGSSVMWNGTALQTNYVSSTVLFSTVPTTDLASSGTASVTVTSPSPGGGNSNVIPFTVSPSVPLLSFSSNSLTFQQGSNGNTQTVAVQNPGTATLTISSIGITGPGAASFQQTNTCGSTLAATANCAVSVLFTPTTNAAQSASLTFVDNAGGSPQSVALSGSVTNSIGLAPASGGSTSATVSAGSTATYNLVIGGLGVSGPVTLTCMNAPTGATCSVPNNVMLSATSPSPITVTVTTTARTAALRAMPVNPLWALFLFGLLLWPAAPRKNQLLRRARLGSVLMLVSLCACGGGGSSGSGTQTNPNGTPAGQYTLNLTATAGSSTQTLPLSLTVQ